MLQTTLFTSLSWETIQEEFRRIVRTELDRFQLEKRAEQLLSPEETRNLFCPPISRTTLYYWTKRGRLTQYRIEGKVYYKYSEVIAAATTLKRYQRSQHTNSF